MLTRDQAAAYIKAIRNPDGKTWKNKRHIATDKWRDGMIPKLSRDPNLKDDSSLNLIEVFLTTELPNIDKFAGIYQVDELGLWYYDGEGRIDDPVKRQRLIPWHCILSLTLYEAAPS